MATATITRGETELADYVTTGDAAKIIGCTPSRVRKMAQDGEIEALKLQGAHNAWIVSLADVKDIALSPGATGRPRTSKPNPVPKDLQIIPMPRPKASQKKRARS